MPPRLLTAADLESALSAPSFLLFKHSTRCGISAAAFARYERWCTAHPEVATGWIDVIEERALAQAVAARTGIRHESPQALLLAHGVARWHASHDAITAASLDAACAAGARR